VLLAGCGGRAHQRAVRTETATPTTGTALGTRTAIAPLGAESTHSPLLVYFKRVIGVDPLGSELTVHRDGSGVALSTFGGIGGQRRRGFRLSGSQYRRLRALVKTAGRDGLRETSCCADVDHYIYTVTLAGDAVHWQQRGVPRADRQLVGLLNRLLDQHIGG
jgi:hypothetical protein